MWSSVKHSIPLKIACNFNLNQFWAPPFVIQINAVIWNSTMHHTIWVILYSYIAVMLSLFCMRKEYILQEYYNSRFILYCPKSILVKVHKKYCTVHGLHCSYTLGVWVSTNKQYVNSTTCYTHWYSSLYSSMWLGYMSVVSLPVGIQSLPCSVLALLSRSPSGQSQNPLCVVDTESPGLPADVYTITTNTVHI